MVHQCTRDRYERKRVREQRGRQHLPVVAAAARNASGHHHHAAGRKLVSESGAGRGIYAAFDRPRREALHAEQWRALRRGEMRTQTEARSRSLVGHAWVQFRTSETRVSPIHVFVSLTSCRTTLDLEVTLHPTNSAAKLLNDAVMRNGAADEGVRAGHLVGI